MLIATARLFGSKPKNLPLLTWQHDPLKLGDPVASGCKPARDGFAAPGAGAALDPIKVIAGSLHTAWRLRGRWDAEHRDARSEEHTSELQSHSDLVCRLL